MSHMNSKRLCADTFASADVAPIADLNAIISRSVLAVVLAMLPLARPLRELRALALAVTEARTKHGNERMVLVDSRIWARHRLHDWHCRGQPDAKIRCRVTPVAVPKRFKKEPPTSGSLYFSPCSLNLTFRAPRRLDALGS